MMFKKLKTKRKERKYFRSMNKGLLFLARLDLATKDWSRAKHKQFWGQLRSPISRVRVLKELFEALNK